MLNSIVMLRHGCLGMQACLHVLLEDMRHRAKQWLTGSIFNIQVSILWHLVPLHPRRLVVDCYTAAFHSNIVNIYQYKQALIMIMSLLACDKAQCIEKCKTAACCSHQVR